jgi:hypothetical protein
VTLVAHFHAADITSDQPAAKYCRIGDAEEEPATTKQTFLNTLHILVHAEKPRYECSEYGHRRNAPSRVKSHMQKHTGKKPYAFRSCPYRSAWAINTKKHQERTHLKIKSIHSHSALTRQPSNP